MISKAYGNDDVDYVGYTGSYINRREVTLYVRVPPGKYVVIPSIYEVVIRCCDPIYTFVTSLIEMGIFSYASFSKPITPLHIQLCYLTCPRVSPMATRISHV